MPIGLLEKEALLTVPVGSVSDPGSGGWSSKSIRDFFGADV